MAEIGGEMAEIGGEMAEISGMAVLRISKCQFCMPETARKYLATGSYAGFGVSQISVAEGCAWASGGQRRL